MYHAITWKEQRNLKKIAKRIVTQSECYANNITEYYKIMVEAARKEFSEDNDATLSDFLLECFQNASEQESNHEQ